MKKDDQSSPQKVTEQAMLLNACKAAYDELRYGSRSDALKLLEEVITKSKIKAHEQIVIEVKPAYLEPVSAPGSAMHAGLTPSDDKNPLEDKDPVEANHTPRSAPWTPEPWDYDTDDLATWVNSVAWPQPIAKMGKCTHFNARANAERIVACVNALAGVSNPAAVKEVIKWAKVVRDDYPKGCDELYDALAALGEHEKQ